MKAFIIYRYRSRDGLRRANTRPGMQELPRCIPASSIAVAMRKNFYAVSPKLGLRQTVEVNCFAAAALSVADEPFFDGVSSRKGLGEQALWFPCIKGKTSDLHKSMTTSRIGCEQQMRRLPVAGFSSGSGP
jgi:hypothetical protein